MTHHSSLITHHASPPADWDSDFLASSGMFSPLRIHAGELGAKWPDLPALQRLLDERAPVVRNAGGRALRLVPQGRRPRAFEEKYETRIFLEGELQVREGNWHDLLNVLVWRAFPCAKAALNARHYAALCEQFRTRTPNRGPAQDALTLFDEGGVVVACADDDLASCLRDWRWKELFWTRRALLPSRMQFHLFGHAIYEKALRPFSGITARGIVLRTPPELLAAPLPEQISGMDVALAAHLADASHLTCTRELAVVPVLGVPGWCADNEREGYYDDVDYFRPLRRQAANGEG